MSDQPLPSFTAAVRLLQRCPSPPSAGAIETARIALQQLQALTDVTSTHADNTGVNNNKLGRKHHTDVRFHVSCLCLVVRQTSITVSSTVLSCAYRFLVFPLAGLCVDTTRGIPRQATGFASCRQTAHLWMSPAMYPTGLGHCSSLDLCQQQIDLYHTRWRRRKYERRT